MRRPFRTVLLVWSLLLMAAAPAAADGTAAASPRVDPGGPRSGEATLREVESDALGAAHAAAHARQRELAASVRVERRERTTPPPLPPVAPADGGAWSTPTPLPVIAINSVLLPTGKVLMFAYPGRPGVPDSGYDNHAKAFVWDPLTKTSDEVDPPVDPRTGKPTNIWCGGASFLPDGRVLVTGGNLDDDPTRVFTGLNTVFVFDPWTQKWERGQPMRQGRWYPTQTLMPDGRTLVVGGQTAPGDPDFPFGIPAGSAGTNNDAEIVSQDGEATTTLPDLRFNVAGQPPLSALYPHMFWLRSGRALAAGPRPTDSWLLTPGPGGASAWDDLPDLSRTRDFGSAVMLDDGRVLTLGGSPADTFVDADNDGLDDVSERPATETSEVFDDADPAAGWQPSARMQIARSHANSVLLPDGSVATVGGGLGEDGGQQYYRWLYHDAQRRVELLDPDTGATVLGAAQAEARTYHSTALLLPDARVLSAGDDINGAGGPGTGVTEDTAEIYSPPYLFKQDGSGDPAERPRIESSPATAMLGADIEITTAGATKAVLVAPGAPTHANDMSQRIVPLAAPVALSQGRLRLHVPSDANVVLPGYYMLFVLSADGVPSVARFIRILAPPTPPPVVDPPAPVLDPVLPPPADPVIPPPAAKAKLTITGALPSLRELRRSGRFTVTVRLTQPGRVSVASLLELRRGRVPALASMRTLRFTTGATRKLTVRLTPAGRRLLAGRRPGAIVRIRSQAMLSAGGRLPTLTTRRRLR